MEAGEFEVQDVELRKLEPRDTPSVSKGDHSTNAKSISP